jgi:hypothetical protein
MIFIVCCENVELIYLAGYCKEYLGFMEVEARE